MPGEPAPETARSSADLRPSSVWAVVEPFPLRSTRYDAEKSYVARKRSYTGFDTWMLPGMAADSSLLAMFTVSPQTS